MNTLLIELTNDKAYQLLQDMEELKLIRLLNRESGEFLSLRHRIKKRMSKEQIEEQLNAIRKEWQRVT